MSLNPKVGLKHYRINSRPSIDYTNQNKVIQYSEQNNASQQIKQIPLILKKMNPVQRYIYDFKVTQMLQKQSRPKRQQSPLYDPALSNSHHINKIMQRSSSSSKMNQNQIKDLQGKCYIKYSSISEHDTGTKYEVLENCQTQYVRLKHSIHAVGEQGGRTLPVNNHSLVNQRAQQLSTGDHNHSYSQSYHYPSFVNPKSIYLLSKKKHRQQQGEDQNKIHSHDIQKQLKTSVIQDNGKKYFADLYLMKRERDKMMKEIFGNSQRNSQKTKLKDNGLQHEMTMVGNNSHENVGDRNGSYKTNKSLFSLQKTSKSFTSSEFQKRFPKLKVNLTQMPIRPSQQSLQSQDQNFIQQKILRDRSQKKQKMLKGRNMNWNVYYEMLALRKNQKDKLKGYCKFSQTYDED